ncbi:MAG: hypothetical protein AB7G62_01410 [Magnetospirillum sp.]
MKRDHSLIDPKIQPLVDALNGIAGVRTIASCEGHFSRLRRPYVYFHCPPALAESMAARLRDFNKALSYWWRLSGEFNEVNRLCFLLEAPRLSAGEGLYNAFTNYIINRQRINRDLSALAEYFNSFRDEIGQIGQDQIKFPGLIHPEQTGGATQGNDDAKLCVAPSPFRVFSEGVSVSASGACHFDIQSKLSATNNTIRSTRLDHQNLRKFIEPAWNIARAFIAVVFLPPPFPSTADLAITHDRRER